MQKVFSSIEVSETVLVRDALLHHGIDAVIQHEHSAYTAVPAHRPPAEVWIRDHAALEAALEIVRQTVAKLDAKTDGEPWSCANCSERNPPAFDLCWSCGHPRPPPEALP